MALALATIPVMENNPLHHIIETLTVLTAAQGEPADAYGEAGGDYEVGTIAGATAALRWTVGLLQAAPVRDHEEEVRRLRRLAIAMLDHHAMRLRLLHP